MAFHREQQEKQFRAEGMTPEAAQHAAAVSSAMTRILKSESHEVVGFRCESVLQDFRFALRQLRKNPGFAVTAILMLALGIAASARHLRLRRCGPDQAAALQEIHSRLVGVYESVQVFPRSNLSWQDYRRLEEDAEGLHRVRCLDRRRLPPRHSFRVQPGRARASPPDSSALSVSRPSSAATSRHGEDQPGAPRTALITYATWQQRFGGRRDIIGQTVTLDGTPTTIIGVLPREFQFAPARAAPSSGCPSRSSTAARSAAAATTSTELRASKTASRSQTALADMKSIAAQLEKQYPDSNRGQGAAVSLSSEDIVGDVRPILLVLFWPERPLLLLIACVNVSSLLLVRSESRKREMAVRGALGASRSRLVRQFLTESLVLVVAGGVLGLARRLRGHALLLRLIPRDMLDYVPYLQGISSQLHACSPSPAMSALLAVAIFSLAPSLRLSPSEPCAPISPRADAAPPEPSGAASARISSSLSWPSPSFCSSAPACSRQASTTCSTSISDSQPDHLATLEVAAPEKTYAKPSSRSSLTRQIIDDASVRCPACSPQP